MRNVLLATVSLAFVSSPAMAADKMSVGVGGYMEQWFGLTDISDSADPKRDGGVSQWSDSEIFFRGKLESDSGLTFSVKVELEANSQALGKDKNGDTIDESQLTIGGSFGQIVLGTEDHPAALMHYGNQDVGVGYCGDSGWVGVTGCARNGGLGLGTNGWIVGGDEQKLAYYTPRMSGVQFGAAYIPDHTKEDENALPNGNDHSGWSVGVNMQQDLGDASVAMSFGHYQVSQTMKAVDLKSGMDLAKAISVREYMGNVAADKRLADAVAGKTITHESTSGTTDTLQQLQVAAGVANAQNMKAFDDMDSKADDHTWTNFGLRVGFGSFSFNAAYARNEGGGYMVEKMPVMVNANNQADRTRYADILNRSATSSATDSSGTLRTDDLEATVGDAGSTSRHFFNQNEGKKNADGTDMAAKWVEESDTVNDPMNDIARTVLMKDESQDYDLMSVGVKYSDGPMAVSLTHMTGEDDAGTEAETTMLSVSYTLAPGVASKSSLISGSQGTVDGTAFVTGIAIGF